MGLQFRRKLTGVLPHEFMDLRGRVQPFLHHVIAQLNPRMHESFRRERFSPCLVQPILRVWQEKRGKRKVNAPPPELPAGNSQIARNSLCGIGGARRPQN